MKMLITVMLALFTFISVQAENPNQSSIGIERENECVNDPANLVDDRAFMRRVWLDLTGVYPDESLIEQFVASQDPNKRSNMINLVANSDGYVDRWTNFFEELFRNRYVLFRTPMFRNKFHESLNQMVRENRPWNEMAQDIIRFAGLGVEEGSAMTFWLTGMIETDYRLDYLDDQTTMITETMLGLKTDCISCHDGAYHLEEVNKGLSVMTRQQFWELSSFLASSYLHVPYEAFDDRDDDERFFAQVHLVELDDTNFVQNGYLVAEEPFNTGEYLAQSEAGDGMRKPRDGGIVEPKFWRTGESPQEGETRRQALARMITSDRQFARNMVNRVWAHLIGEGFVEPLDGWDLGRLDEISANDFDTTVQAKTPDLMEVLTDQFIATNYDLRALIIDIANSSLYQWDYAKSKPCHDAYKYWRGNQRVRRMEAESIYEAYLRFLELDFKYVVTGYPDRTFQSTWQMPGTIEPNPGALLKDTDRRDLIFITDPRTLGYQNQDDYFLQQGVALRMMRDLGRDNRLERIPRINETSIQLALMMMNNELMTFYIENMRASPFLTRMTEKAMRGDVAETQEVVESMFKRALLRLPNETEMDVAVSSIDSADARQSIANLAWVLINHPDFLHK